MLLERDDEIAQLGDLLGSAASGAGRVAVLLGEAGIGKSALVRSFLKAAGPTVRVLRGACEDLSIAEPLAPLRDLAREAGWDLPDVMAASSDRLSVFSAALDILADPAVTTAILVEDIHWADDATLDFLRYFARRIEDRKVLLLMTARDDEREGQPRVRRAVGGLTSDTVTRLALKPLSRSAVATLSAGSGRDAGAIYDLAGGNAFYVTELLRGQDEQLPPSIRDSVLARADLLDAPSRRLLDAVSIFPGRAEKVLIAAVVPEMEAAIDVVVSLGLLEETATSLAFRHELARRAVETSLTAGHRRRLHENVLAHLSRAPGTSEARLLHHALGANDVAAILRLAPGAASNALRLGALSESLGYFRLALEHLPASETALRAELTRDFAWANYQMGRWADAIEAETQALEYFAASNDIVREGDSYRRMSRFHWLAGHRAAAQDFANRAVRTLANHRGPELALAYSTVAQLAMLDHDDEAVVAPSEAAMELAREFDRPDILAHSLNNRGMTLVWTDPDEGRRMLAESLSIAHRIKSNDDIARAYTNWTFFEMYRLNFDRSIELAETGMTFAKATEQDGYVAYLSGAMSWSLIAKGRFSDAVRIAETGRINSTASLGAPFATFTWAASMIWTALRTGEAVDNGASEYLETFIAEMDELQRLEVYAQILAERAWMGLDSREHAADVIGKVLSRARDADLVPFVLLWMHKLNPDAAIPRAANLIDPIRLQIGGHWREAADAWRVSGATFFEGLALSGGDEEARQQALRLFASMGATGTMKAVQAEMRKDGLTTMQTGPRRSTLENPAGLTRRQMDVLKALNEGLSNAEIASSLFISQKTVDHHVSAILMRLDASTRGEAAAKARQSGLI